MGYVLRVSEANGYDTPWHFLKHAGIRQGGMDTAGFPVDKFAEVIGMPAAALSAWAYLHPDDQGRRMYQLLGHQLGACLTYDPLRLAKPAVCPDCVAEQGHIDAFFDLNLAVACPTHRRAVVSQCPACHAPLTLFRPGLLTCRCGASPRDAAPVPVSESVVALMNILKARLHKTPLSAAELTGQLPVEHLLGLPIRAMLVNLPNLAKFTRPDAGENMSAVVEGVAEALTDWPNGFHRVLHRISDSQPSATIAYQKRFKKLCGLFFNVKTVREDFHWLHEEFLRYGLEFEPRAIVHPRMLRGRKAEHRFISQNDLARHLDVYPATIRSWVDKGLIALNRVETPSGHRYVADTRAVESPPLAVGSGRILQQREAAAYLKIPVSVLAHLKDSGHLPCQHRIKFKIGFHEADLDAFLVQLLARSTSIDPATLGTVATVSLERALGKYRLHDSQQKAQLVVAYLSGELKSLGRTGNTTADIFFNLSDVTALVAASRAHAAGGTLSQREVARFIECDPQALPWLLAEGHLEQSKAREGTRITRESAKRFAEAYVALSKLANDLDSSSNRLMRLARRERLPLLLIPRANGCNLPFIERTRLDALLAVEREHPSRSQLQAATAGTEHPAVVAVKHYLAELQENEMPLPRRAGKPNKVVIARACGFARDVLYDNAEVAGLLAAYANQSRGASGLTSLSP